MSLLKFTLKCYFSLSLWKNLAKEWETNYKHIIWEIGDGTLTNAWDDYWEQGGVRIRNVLLNPGLC